MSSEHDLATPEQSQKFIESLHAHEKCPVCKEKIGSCQHRCGRDFRAKDVSDPPHVARPWGYKGTMKLPHDHPDNPGF